jgi:phenylalanyl-tRNA synthetase beta chain
VDKAQASADAPDWYHPGRSGALRLGPTVLAWFGEIHPRVLDALDVKGPVAAFEVFLDAIPRPKAKASKARPLLQVSAFQPVKRDFAFVVDDAIAAATLIGAIRGAARALVTAIEVFDVFTGAAIGEGKKSVALSVTLQPSDRTMTDAEIEAVCAKIVATVEKRTGGVLRG